MPEDVAARELLSDGSIRITLNSGFFERDAILRATYWFTRDCFVSIAPPESEDTVSVLLRPKQKPASSRQDPRPLQIEEIANRFENAR